MRDLIGAGRGAGQFGGVLPTCRTYRCSDGQNISVGSLEERLWTCLADQPGLRAGERIRSPAARKALEQHLEAIFPTNPAKHGANA